VSQDRPLWVEIESVAALLAEGALAQVLHYNLAHSFGRKRGQLSVSDWNLKIFQENLK
jgi:hypothetical protein